MPLLRKGSVFNGFAVLRGRPESTSGAAFALAEATAVALLLALAVDVEEDTTVAVAGRLEATTGEELASVSAFEPELSSTMPNSKPAATAPPISNTVRLDFGSPTSGAGTTALGTIGATAGPPMVMLETLSVEVPFARLEFSDCVPVASPAAGLNALSPGVEIASVPVRPRSEPGRESES